MNADDAQNDDLSAARGIVFAVLIAIVLWLSLVVILTD